jgi:hypothetical protein
MTENKNYAVAIDIQNKFDFYFIGLIFTLLGLSIQTSQFIAKNNLQNTSEVVGWVLLAISGLLGMSRLEWKPVMYRHFGELDSEKDTLNTLTQNINRATFINPDTGNKHPIDVIQKDIISYKQRVEIREGEIDKIENSSNLKYTLQKLSFFIGLVSLMLSRVLAKVLV